MPLSNLLQWVLGSLLIFSSLGVILSKKPVHSCLAFLLTLFITAVLFLQLSAHFIAVMQVLVYAGAILVIFMYVIVLFQDAHQQIEKFTAKSSRALLMIAAGTFLLALIFLGKSLLNIPVGTQSLAEGFGTVESLGQALYIDFFFPFEAVIFIFLIALIGALYIGKKGK